MFSYFYSSQPEPAKHDPTTPYPELGDDFNPDVCFKQLLSYYEGKDTNAWQVQVDEPGFKQFWCYAEGSSNLMMKAHTKLKAPVKELIETMHNCEERKKWDTAMADIRVFHTSEDGSFTRMTFNF